MYGAWQWWTHDRPVHRRAGITAAEAPRQTLLDPAPTTEHAGYQLIRRARYDIEARVLRKELYRFDGGAALAPVDLALGWQRMSDSAMLDELEITQMGRFFYWRPRHPDSFTVPPSALVSEVGQVHAIPANGIVDDALRHLRPGQIVHLQGYLVDVRGPGGFAWNTSLSRDDTGAGACEIMWIESVAVR